MDVGRAWVLPVYCVAVRGGPCAVLLVRGGPCAVLPCVAGRAGVRRPDGTQRMNGKAVRSHSGERTACRCVSGAVASELITFGNADLSRLADLLHFF